MALLTLNCPTCRKRLTYLPRDGLTLHYRCDEHGLLVFTPLVMLNDDEWLAVDPSPIARDTNHLHTHDAA